MANLFGNVVTQQTCYGVVRPDSEVLTQTSSNESPDLELDLDMILCYWTSRENIYDEIADVKKGFAS